MDRRASLAMTKVAVMARSVATLQSMQFEFVDRRASLAMTKVAVIARSVATRQSMRWFAGYSAKKTTAPTPSSHAGIEQDS